MVFWFVLVLFGFFLSFVVVLLLGFGFFFLEWSSSLPLGYFSITFSKSIGWSTRSGCWADEN